MEAYLENPPFLKLHHNWQVIANTAFRRLAEEVVTEARANIDVSRSGLHNRSGMLRDSIKLLRFYQLAPGGEATAVIGAGNKRVPYAAIHEYGGVIKPKTKPFLRFKIGEQWISTKQVVMPSRPYLRPAVTTKTAEFDTFIQEAIDRIQAALK